MIKYKKNKKGINSVVSMALLLVVTVVAVVSFQTWLNSYSKVTNAQAEIESNSLSTNTGIDSISGNVLYFRSNFDNIRVMNVTIGDTECYGTNKVFGKGLHNITITPCTSIRSGDTFEIVVITNKGVYSSKQYIK